jgi:hypothetical protein
MEWATPATMGIAFGALWTGYLLGVATLAAVSMNREPDAQPARPATALAYCW